MAKSRSSLTRMTIMRGTQADISARNASLTEARLAARTEDNLMGYTPDNGANWYFPPVVNLQTQITALIGTPVVRHHGYIINLNTINAYAAGNTSLGRTDATGTKLFSPREILFFVVAKTGTPVVTSQTITIGTNSPNYNNIASFAVSDLAGVVSAGASAIRGVSSTATLPLNTEIFARITGLALGVGTLTYGIDLRGVYL